MRKPLLICASLLAGSGIAAAHPQPRTASPKPNDVLSASPQEIRIGFSEALEGAFSGLEVDDAAGKAAPAGDAMLDPKDSKVLIVPLKGKLAPGAYTVKWHAVSTDTHRVTGHYSFSVAK